ncbi:hypothetical protein ZWY2020_040614 [Hordeum vulgare]|nr:hypothetical protein ZWY2020_040614 [Hordeum vulgare]
MGRASPSSLLVRPWSVLPSLPCWRYVRGKKRGHDRAVPRGARLGGGAHDSAVVRPGGGYAGETARRRGGGAAMGRRAVRGHDSRPPHHYLGRYFKSWRHKILVETQDFH